MPIYLVKLSKNASATLPGLVREREHLVDCFSHEVHDGQHHFHQLFHVETIPCEQIDSCQYTSPAMARLMLALCHEGLPTSKSP